MPSNELETLPCIFTKKHRSNNLISKVFAFSTVLTVKVFKEIKENKKKSKRKTEKEFFFNTYLVDNMEKEMKRNIKI